LDPIYQYVRWIPFIRSNLANEEFIQWLPETMLDFAEQTGAGGFSFDATFLEEGLPIASNYAQVPTLGHARAHSSAPLLLYSATHSAHSHTLHNDMLNGNPHTILPPLAYYTHPHALTHLHTDIH
jgi:hypothetical protein